MMFRQSAIVLLLFWGACGSAAEGEGGGSGAVPSPKVWEFAQYPYDTLSEYGFFAGDLSELTPSSGVLPYSVASSLWSDFAWKRRFLVPQTLGTVEFTEREDWSFSEGSVVIKNFLYPNDFRDESLGHRVVETRLLVLEKDGWVGHTYVWNDDQTDARRVIAGDRLLVSFTDAEGTARDIEYIVPNTNQCKNCHAHDDENHLLGAITPQLNMDVERDGGTVNQLSWLSAQGLFKADVSDPSRYEAFVDPLSDGPLEERARSYLAANCSHCHRQGGGASNSGLVLLAWETDQSKLGVCKKPAAAGAGTGGHDYDIVPGAPDESILIYRISSTEPDVRMPELPNQLPNEPGIQLLSDWIEEMEPKSCFEGD